MAANTPVTYYIDTPAARAVCADERRDIERKCKPEPPQSDEDEKPGTPRKRKAGLSGKLAEAAAGLDDLGKTTAGYKRDKGSLSATNGNAWMEDHCSGLWITPTDAGGPDFEAKLKEMFEKIENDKLSLLKNGLDQLKDVAIEQAGNVANQKLQFLAVRTGAKIAVGLLGIETGAVTAAMGAWTAADVMRTAKELADLAGPKGQAAYEALVNIKNIKEKAQGILSRYMTHPHEAQAEAMAIMAQLDPCVRARKCMLVPFENTSGRPRKATVQARHGQGCCPGQTGHHILPDAMVKSAGCSGYDRNKAPTICMEGIKNSGGSHGLAHKNLSKSLDIYKEKARSDQISYDEAKKQGLDAIQRAGALHCSRQCLGAQLDAHYQGCKGKLLKANAGTGGVEQAPTPLPADGNAN